MDLTVAYLAGYILYGMKLKNNIVKKGMWFMKRFFAFLASLFILSSAVSAHPGRTDANGGHWDRSAGEYHFHTGEYAGRNSSGSSSSSSSSNYFVPPYDPPTENPYRQKQLEKIRTEKQKDDGRSRKFVIACSCYSVFILLYLWSSDSTLFKG